MKKTKKNKVFLLSAGGSSASVVCLNKEDIISYIEDLQYLEVGDRFTITVGEFTNKELANLPEFDGF